MKVAILLLADYANTTAEGKLNVMGIFNRIQAAHYPARHSTMFVVLRLALELGDLDQQKQLTIKLEDSDGNEVYSMTVPVEIKRDAAGIRPDANVILQLLDTVIPKQGSYQFSVYLGNELEGAVELTAIQV